MHGQKNIKLFTTNLMGYNICNHFAGLSYLAASAAYNTIRLCSAAASTKTPCPFFPAKMVKLPNTANSNSE